jgi:OOP family OmpA-OmpF porin
MLLFVVSLYSAEIPKYEIRPHVSGVVFEDKYFLDNGHFYGIDFAKGFGDKFMLNLSLNRTTLDYNSKSSVDDFYLFGLNGEYYYYEKGNIQSYITAGVSYLAIDEKPADESDLLGFNYGVGAKYLINEDVGLYTEVKHLTTFQKNENQFVYTFGVLIPFGYESPVQREAPALLALVHEEETTEKLLYPNDDDRDGVVNKNDKCPNSNLDYEVNNDGCTITYPLHVKFEFDSSVLKSSSMKVIKDFAIFMDEPVKLNIEIQGHSDTQGSLEYNQRLSERRAEAVYNALIAEGIDKERMQYVGYGETQLLIIENDIKENFAENRRVQILILKSE